MRDVPLLFQVVDLEGAQGCAPLPFFSEDVIFKTKNQLPKTVILRMSHYYAPETFKVEEGCSLSELGVFTVVLKWQSSDRWKQSCFFVFVFMLEREQTQTRSFLL